MPEGEPLLPAEPAEPAEPTGDAPQDPPSGGGSLVGEDGSLSEGWAKSLGMPEETHSHLGGIKSLKELATSHYGMRQRIGEQGNRVKPITADSSEEEINEWRKAHHIPQDTDGYDYKSSLTEDQLKEISEDEVKPYLEIIHKHNGSPALLNDLLQKNFELHGASKEQAAAAAAANQQAEVDKLKAEWGSEFNAKAASAARVANVANIPEDSHLRYDPAFLRFASVMAGLVGEDRLPSGDDGSPQGRMGATQQKERAVRIQTGKTSDATELDLHERYKRGEDAAVTLVRALNRGKA